tara:strand:+ start:9588 stop:11747 length:2160 start_codon:yes stop_codon:yes gene_type:complete
MNKAILIGIIACIVIGIAVGIFFGVKDLTKKSDSDEEERPDLQFNKAAKTLQPQEGNEDENADPGDAVVEQDEGYQIEYETGTDESGNKSIDITVSWKNGMGFSKVEKLIFRREVADSAVQEDIVVDSGDGIANNGGGKITFKGDDLTDPTKSIIGVNKISAWFNEVKGENLLADTGEDIKITQADLDTTIDLTTAEVVDVPITLDKESFKAEKIGRETLYLIEEFHQCFKMKQLGGGKVEFTQILTNEVDKLWDNADSFKLKKYKDGFMLGHPEDSTKVLVRRVLTKDDIDFSDNKAINHKPTFKKLSEMKKAEYARALFHLEPVRTAIRSDRNGGKMETGKEYHSPSGKFTFKQHPNKITLHIYDQTQKTDVWAAAQGPRPFNKPCDTPKLQGDGNFFMKVTGSQDDWGYRSDTWQHGNGRAPYRIVVGDNATVSILKKDGRVIHYIFRAKPISIATAAGGAPKWSSWTSPSNRFKHSGLAILHDRWYKKSNEGGWIKLDNGRHAKDWGYKWVAYTMSDGNAGHHYELFNRWATVGANYVYLPDGACDIQSNHKRTEGSSVITGQKADSTAPTLYKGPEHVKFAQGGYDTWKIYYIPSLPLEGYVNKNNQHDALQSSEDQRKEEYFGDDQCRTRANEFDGANAFVYRHYRSDTDGWTHTCAPVKLFNIDNLRGNVNYETNPSRHATGCTNPLKSARTGCSTAIDVPERGGTYQGSVR